MDWKVLGTVFTSVFIAELGDKTQLATMLFASDKDASKLTVFAGATAALIVTSAIGVAAGSAVSQYVSEKNVALSGGYWVYRHRHLDAVQSVNEESS
jgi:putative Ca2+/H+ antiporter (TMEM165/GDT1 family)